MIETRQTKAGSGTLQVTNRNVAHPAHSRWDPPVELKLPSRVTTQLPAWGLSRLLLQYSLLLTLCPLLLIPGLPEAPSMTPLPHQVSCPVKQPQEDILHSPVGPAPVCSIKPSSASSPLPAQPAPDSQHTVSSLKLVLNCPQTEPADSSQRQFPCQSASLLLREAFPGHPSLCTRSPFSCS